MNVTLKTFLSSFWATGLLLFGLTIICFLFALQFENFEGGADNYIHYRVSRYCFNYPELFLDHWGKPVFTLISSPFAQFGFKGLIFFNVLSGVLASFFTWKVAQQLKLAHAWVGIILVLSMPVYFIMMASAMTEVFFSLMLIVSVYYFLKEKYILSGILFSTLFLIRTEGYIFYPFVAAVFAFKRQWLAIPFLGTFSLLYSIVGGFYFGDFLWLINQIPYGDTSDLYGTGELLFFAKKHDEIFGTATSYLILAGGLIAGIQSLILLFKERKVKHDLILIEVLFTVYFAAHSYVWWSGTGASAGLIRVMAAIAPLAAIMSIRAISFLTEKVSAPKIYYTIALVLFSIYLVRVPFKTYPIPFKYGEREKTVAAAVSWMQDSKYSEAKVYFYEPLIYFLLDRDPFNHEIIKELIDDREHPENVTRPGELIFYDMHFGPNEGRLPLKNLMENPFFRLVNYFEPLEPFTVLGGYNYAVYVFERVENNPDENEQILENIKREKTKSELWKRVISADTPFLEEEFTPLLEIKASDISSIKDAQIVRADMEYSYEDSNVSAVDKLLVISIEKNGEALIYKTAPLEEEGSGKNKKIAADAVLSKKLKGDETIKIYIWSKTRQPGKVHSLNVYTIKKTY